LIGPSQGFIAAFQDVHDQLAIQVPLLMFGLFFKAVDTDMEFADFAFKGLTSFTQVALFLVGHRFHIGVGHRLAGLEGDNPEADRGFLKPKSTSSAELRQFVEERFFLGIDVVVQFSLGIEVLLALKRQGNVAPQSLDESRHFSFQRCALSGRKRERGRTRGVLEVIDIAPVGRGGSRLGQAFNHLSNERAFPRADGT
jgi:hypothetical protein